MISAAPTADSLRGLRVGVAAISMSGGGAERQAVLWADAAHGCGARVALLALEARERSYAAPDGASVTVVGKTAARDTPRAIRQLRRWARGQDVIAAFQPYMGVLCVLARVPHWVLVAGEDPRHWHDTSRLPRALYRAAFRRAACATAPSLGLIDCHRELGLVPRQGWSHVPNLVPEEAFDARVDAVDRHGILFVGRLVPEKDPLLALRSAIAAGLSISFLGDGPLRPALLTEAARLRVEGRVRLDGFTSSPWGHYARHRATVVTSRYETFASVIVESLAAGTPVVSVDCDFGPREILAGTRFSRLVSADPEALSGALRELAQRPPSPAERAECRHVAGRYRPAALRPAIAAALDAAARPRRG